LNLVNSISRKEHMALWTHTGMQLVAIEINNAYFAKFAILDSPFC